MYTQNIDCLEEGCIENAGEKVIFVHGKMRDDFLCSGCAKKSPYAEIKHWLGQQEESSAVPKCNDCGSPLRVSQRGRWPPFRKWAPNFVARSAQIFAKISANSNLVLLSCATKQADFPVLD